MQYRYGVIHRLESVNLNSRRPRTATRIVHILWDFLRQEVALVGAGGDPQFTRDAHVSAEDVLHAEVDYNQHHREEQEAARRRRVEAMRRNPRLIPRPKVRRPAPRAVQLLIDFGGA